MQDRRRGPRAESSRPRRARKQLTPVIIGWGWLGLGVGLAIAATVLWLDPATSRAGITWWVGGLAFLGSLVLSAAGISSASGIGGTRTPPHTALRTLMPVDREVPPLGELLVEHCHALTAEDRDRALERQKETGQPLGQILLEMGVITQEVLDRALRLQTSLRDVWRDVPGDHSR